MSVSVEDLKRSKADILEKLKEIKNDIKNDNFKILRAEYMKVHNKIRYYSDEEYRKNKIEYVQNYRGTFKPLIKA